MRKRSRRWSEAEARQALAGLDSSGLSAQAYAEQHGIHPERFRRWRARIRSRSEAPPAAMRLVELLPHTPPSLARVVVTCPSGHTIEVLDVDLVSCLRAVVAATATAGGTC